MHDFIFIKDGKKHIKIKYDDIIYIEAVNNYVKIITRQNNYLWLQKMKDVSECLCPYRFCRIHRSYIVNIELMRAYDLHTVYLESCITLPVSKQLKSDLDAKVAGRFPLKAKMDQSQKN